MHTIAFVSQKGGAGKTTLATCLAVAAAEAGEKVIALDLDPQGSLAAWGRDRTANDITVLKLDAADIPDIKSELPKLAGKGFTLAILDCAGTASTGINLAMQAANLCVIPIRPTRMDIRATRPTVEALMGMKQPFSFVLNACPASNFSPRAREAAVGLALMGGLIEPAILERTVYYDAYAEGQGVTEREPGGKAAGEIRELWANMKTRLKG